MKKAINNSETLFPTSQWISVSDMTKKIKGILERHIKDRKVLDSDVADILRIKRGTFGVMKAQDRMPTEQLESFCNRTGVRIEEFQISA